MELRLDGVGDVDVAGALEGRQKPVIVTCRPAWAGGRFEGAEETRLAWLSQAAKLGAEYVDVEHDASWQSLSRGERTEVILSLHDWEGVPRDLGERVRSMRRAGASVIKVAVTARRLEDCLTLRAACTAGDPLVAIAMGRRGRITRTCPWLFNSCWTYAGAAAPGQLTIDELLDQYRVRQGSAATVLYGVAGRPLGHSASPAMHNAALAAAGLDAVYVALEGESADDVESAAQALGVSGLSVTAPFKQDFFSRAVARDERTQMLGAANTLRRTAAGWEARNFDVDAFLEPIDQAGHQLAGEPVVVLGAGGAARAAVAALVERRARVSVAARRPEQAERLAEHLGVDVDTWPPKPGWTMLVNATSAGTWPDESYSPLPAEALTGRVVYDLVYNPPETALMRAARARGAEAIGGLDMLVGQACLQFEWWTGRPAPREIMRRAAQRFVTEENHEADDV